MYKDRPYDAWINSHKIDKMPTFTKCQAPKITHTCTDEDSEIDGMLKVINKYATGLVMASNRTEC